MPSIFSARRLILTGGALIFLGLLTYDLATYFHLQTVFVVVPLLFLLAGLAALAVGAAKWVWQASAGKLAAVGLALTLGFAMAEFSPTVFAPPSIQGGENEMFRGVPFVLAVAGGLLLGVAGLRYMATRHNPPNGR
jgi:hypothetical protein